VVGSSRPRLETGGAGPGDEAPRSREASKRRSATAGRSRSTGHHRATSRTARCPKLRAAAFRLTARGLRVGAAEAASSSETVMEMLRIVDDGIGKEGSGGEMVAVVGLPFSGWVGSWPGKGRESPTKAGPSTTLRHFGGPWATAAQKSRTAPQAATFVRRYSCFSHLPPRSHAVRHVETTSSIRVTPSQFPTSPVSCFKESRRSDVVTQGQG
jgi:hypothetical protein